jgi:lysophospholipase L1-like esterase
LKTTAKTWQTAPLLWAVGLLLIAELVVRVGWQRNMSGRFDYGYHPTAGFVEDGDQLHLVRAGGRRFRPQSMPLEPAPGKLRVFVLGDSVPRGGSLPGAYAGQLPAALEKLGVIAESYNFGVPGYGVRRVQIMLRQALHYAPDIVVIHVNNSNEFEDDREWRRRNTFRGWHPRLWLMKSLLLRRLHEAKTEKVFWELLPPAVRLQNAVQDADAEITAAMNEGLLAEWDQRVADVTRASVREARSRGARVVLVSQANWQRGTENIDRLTALETLCSSLVADDVVHVSMYDTLKNGEPPSSLFADGAHLRGRGHEILAEAIAAGIPERWLRKP